MIPSLACFWLCANIICAAVFIQIALNRADHEGRAR